MLQEPLLMLMSSAHCRKSFICWGDGYTDHLLWKRRRWFKIKWIRCNSQVFTCWHFDSSRETNKEPADGWLMVTQAAERSRLQIGLCCATTSCCITLLEDTHSHLVRTSDNTFDWRQVTDLDYLCAVPGCGVFQEIKQRAFAVLYLCCIS